MFIVYMYIQHMNIPRDIHIPYFNVLLVYLFFVEFQSSIFRHDCMNYTKTGLFFLGNVCI